MVRFGLPCAREQMVMSRKLGSGLWAAGMHSVMDLGEKTLNMSMVVKLERTPPTGAYLVGVFSQIRYLVVMFEEDIRVL